MVGDVFSSFDGSSGNIAKLSLFLWVYGPPVFAGFVVSDVFMMNSSSGKFCNKILSFSYSIVKLNGKGVYIGGFPLVISGLFLLIIILNMSNNIPCFYPVSGQFCFGYSFAFSSWMALSLSSFFSHFEHSFMRLVPSGCPLILSPLMMVIESVSGVLRPVTLTLRMSLNIATGKVILAMVSDVGVRKFLLALFKSKGVLEKVEVLAGLIFGGTLMIGMELCVACLQCYVFCMLLCLYSEDHSV